MKQEVYRFAFDEANSELSQILGEFEQLRARKDRIEKVVEALKPLAGIEASGAGSKKVNNSLFHGLGSSSFARPKRVRPSGRRFITTRSVRT